MAKGRRKWKPDFTSPDPWAGMPTGYGKEKFLPTTTTPLAPWEPGSELASAIAQGRGRGMRDVKPAAEAPVQYSETGSTPVGRLHHAVEPYPELQFPTEWIDTSLDIVSHFPIPSEFKYTANTIGRLIREWQSGEPGDLTEQLTPFLSPTEYNALFGGDNTVVDGMSAINESETGKAVADAITVGQSLGLGATLLAALIKVAPIAAGAGAPAAIGALISWWNRQRIADAVRDKLEPYMERMQEVAERESPVIEKEERAEDLLGQVEAPKEVLPDDQVGRNFLEEWRADPNFLLIERQARFNREKRLKSAKERIKDIMDQYPDWVEAPETYPIVVKATTNGQPTEPAALEGGGGSGRPNRPPQVPSYCRAYVDAALKGSIEGVPPECQPLLDWSQQQNVGQRNLRRRGGEVRRGQNSRVGKDEIRRPRGRGTKSS
jgi:hypothetical protein